MFEGAFGAVLGSKYRAQEPLLQSGSLFEEAASEDWQVLFKNLQRQNSFDACQKKESSLSPGAIMSRVGLSPMSPSDVIRK